MLKILTFYPEDETACNSEMSENFYETVYPIIDQCRKNVKSLVKCSLRRHLNF